jgi:hypothetical protein
LDTIHAERTYDFYVPFVFAPFTNRIADLDYVMSWEAEKPPDPGQRSVLHRRDQVLSVNGRPFRGVSVYLQELLKTKRKWHPFTIAVRSADETVRRIEVGFPNCTCGIPTLPQAFSVWLVPPLFCEILGLAVVFLRPRAILAWGFLGAMLSLSQVQFWPDFYPGFQLTSTPMTWDGYPRVFAVGYRALVQSSWPAALLIASTYFYRIRRRPLRAAIGIAAAILLYASAQAALQIAWSEDFRPWVGVYRLLTEYRTGFIVSVVVAVVAEAWFLSAKFGAVASGLGLTAVAFCWTAKPITYEDLLNFADANPKLHNTPGLVMALFTAAMLGLVLGVFRRRVTVLEVFSACCMLPILGDFAARLGSFWFPLAPGFFQYWLWLALLLAGVGLVGLSWAILQRTRAERP